MIAYFFRFIICTIFFQPFSLKYITNSSNSLSIAMETQLEKSTFLSWKMQGTACCSSWFWVIRREQELFLLLVIALDMMVSFLYVQAKYLM